MDAYAFPAAGHLQRSIFYPRRRDPPENTSRRPPSRRGYRGRGLYNFASRSNNPAANVQDQYHHSTSNQPDIQLPSRALDRPSSNSSSDASSAQVNLSPVRGSYNLRHFTPSHTPLSTFFHVWVFSSLVLFSLVFTIMSVLAYAASHPSNHNSSFLSQFQRPSFKLVSLNYQNNPDSGSQTPPTNSPAISPSTSLATIASAINALFILHACLTVLQITYLMPLVSIRGMGYGRGANHSFWLFQTNGRLTAELSRDEALDRREEREDAAILRARASQSTSSAARETNAASERINTESTASNSVPARETASTSPSPSTPCIPSTSGSVGGANSGSADPVISTATAAPSYVHARDRSLSPSRTLSTRRPSEMDIEEGRWLASGAPPAVNTEIGLGIVMHDDVDIESAAAAAATRGYYTPPSTPPLSAIAPAILTTTAAASAESEAAGPRVAVDISLSSPSFPRLQRQHPQLDNVASATSLSISTKELAKREDQRRRRAEKRARKWRKFEREGRARREMWERGLLLSVGEMRFWGAGFLVGIGIWAVAEGLERRVGGW